VLIKGDMVDLYKPTDGIVSRYINRKISTRITMLIIKYNVKVTPNQMSIITFLIGIASALIYLLNMPLVAGIAVQISSIIDGVDGELARALGKATRFGGFLDALLDRFVDVAVITCISAYLISNYSHLISPYFIVLVTMLALSSDLMVSYLHARGEASLGIHPLKVGPYLGYASRDVRLFIIFVASVIEEFIPTTLFHALIALILIGYSYVVIKTINIYLAKVGVKS